MPKGALVLKYVFINFHVKYERHYEDGDRETEGEGECENKLLYEWVALESGPAQPRLFKYIISPQLISQSYLFSQAVR